MRTTFFDKFCEGITVFIVSIPSGAISIGLFLLGYPLLSPLRFILWIITTIGLILIAVSAVLLVTKNNVDFNKKINLFMSGLFIFAFTVIPLIGFLKNH